MGLDMYLNVKRRLEFRPLNEGAYDGLYYQKYEEVGIGYWRKFNALHSLIVGKFAEVDDCNPIWLDTDQLEEVLAILKAVHEDNSKASELLPPQSGFFFGGTDIDEWYLENLAQSIPVFEEAIKQSHTLNNYIYYQASW